VPVSCSIDDAISCRLEAVRSVRWLRSWLPVAISRLAVLQPMAVACTSMTAVSMRSIIVRSAVAAGVVAATWRRSSVMRPLPSMADTS